MLPHNIQLRCADLMRDLLEETRHLSSKVKVTVRIYPKADGCLIRTKVKVVRNASELYVSRLWMRVGSDNIGRAHMFFGTVQDLANFMFHR